MRDARVGQDWVDLLIAGPVLWVAAWSAATDRRAQLIVGALLLYVAYSYAIYAVAVHFNALFLVYCAVFGSAAFALVDLVIGLIREPRLDVARPRLVTATLFAIAGLFGSLWLGSILPALATGKEPAALSATGLTANPVQVLDLALILPAMVVVGVALRRGRPWASVLASILLGFGVVRAIAIGGMIVTLYLRGLSLDLAPSAVMAVVAVFSASVLYASLRSINSRARDAVPTLRAPPRSHGLGSSP